MTRISIEQFDCWFISAPRSSRIIWNVMQKNENDKVSHAFSGILSIRETRKPISIQ